MNEELPEGWEWTTIGEVADVQLGRQRSPQHHRGAQMRPYLRSANVTWDGISVEDVNEMNFDDVDFEKYRLVPGDLLLNEASGSPHEVGKPAIWKGEIRDCCFQNTLLRLRPRDTDLSYLYWYCLYSALTGQFGEAGRGVNIRHLGKRGLGQFPIPVAPEDEQEHVVAAIEEHLSRLDGALSSLDLAGRKLTLLHGLQPSIDGNGEVDSQAERQHVIEGREALFRAAEDQKIVAHPGARRAKYTEPTAPSLGLPQPPAGAVWMTLDELCHFSVDYRGKTPPRADTGIPTISAANVRDGVVEVDHGKCVSHETYSSWISRGIPEPGDLVVTTEAPVASVGLFPEGGPYLPTRRVIVLKTGLVDNRYLLSALANPVSQQHLRSHTRGSTVPRILKPALLSTPVPVVGRAAQARAVVHREATLVLHGHVEAAIRDAQRRGSSLRRAVLAAAFSGRLVDQDPTDETGPTRDRSFAADHLPTESDKKMAS